VWLAFVLMLTIFHHPKAKTFCLATFLAKKKRAIWQAFFSCKKIAKQKEFCLTMMKNS
jgi:hypothetical protein